MMSSYNIQRAISNHKMHRSYKEDTPENTINRITQILKTMDIIIHKESFDDIDGFLFSCRYNLNGISYIGQNGKGITKEFAIAGALSELMERLQNFIIFATKLGMNETEILRIFPDIVKVEGFNELSSLNPEKCKPDIHRLCEEVLKSSFCPLYLDKFYDVKNDEVVLLPHPNMVTDTGSNGMCSGNTPAEALVQGICEILERAAMKEVLAGNVLPPTIPSEYINNTTCGKIIEALTDRNVSIIVKDCSLGKGYPVVGAIAINKATGRYKFSAGSHPIFDYALERTITELYQGYSSGDISRMGHALILGKGLYSNCTEDLNAARIANFKRQITTGRGELPEKIFYENPTYEFEPWKAFKGSQSYEEDLKILTSLIISKGSNIYIRDVSFLDFPSYYIYIIGHSSIWSHTESFKKIYDISSTINLRGIYSNLAGSSEEEIRNLIRYIELITSSSEITEEEKPSKWLSMIFESMISSECLMAPEHILALLYFKLRDYEKSYRNLDDLFKKYDMNREALEHLFAFKDALFLLSKKREIDDIKKILSSYYHENNISTVMTMLTIPDINLAGIEVPKPSDYSRYQDCLLIFEQMRKKVEASSIDQYGLSEHFY